MDGVPIDAIIGIIVGIVFLAIAWVMYKKKNSKRSKDLRRKEYFEDYDKRMDYYRK